MGGLRVKFVKVCDWFNGCIRLKYILKSLKNKITKLYYILKIIKIYHYISLIYGRKNMKMYKLKWHIIIKQSLKDNVTKKL